MRPPPVVIGVTQFFPHGMEAAYAWLTDFDDEDPGRANRALRRRRVLERTPHRVRMEGDVELAGVLGRTLLDVRLHPPDRWAAEVVGGHGRGSVHEFVLAPRRGGCVLHARYRIRARRWRAFARLLVARRKIRKDIQAMWVGFAQAMSMELKGEEPAP